MPRKTNHRMHAHINPFNPLNFDHPINTRFVDWSVHYPLFYGIKDNNKNKIVVNTKKNPMPGSYVTLCDKQGPTPSILDIGCGYGGLMFQLTKGFPNQLILGLEIRDKVANFVGEKINSIRHNSNQTKCANTAIIRSNAMKTMTNYFPKQSVRTAS